MKNENYKYRLRLNYRIIGYAEETSEGLLFKGSEALWWMRGRPNYNQIDKFTGIQDKFHRDIFERDLVYYKINDDSSLRKGLITWDEKNNVPGILDLESKHFTHIFISGICLFLSEKMEIYSHIFNHPELLKKFE